eukprot:TRINITY_DN3745_c1_g1_i1.p1 TRINITY_DN3745_c1_g1~~TRINITY_DN3745_c1_g1_i1.p1  ORF type:complete len:472 (+),score=61.43 TRINITY_DN3745_c1_g1_i1:110-1417(+)
MYECICVETSTTNIGYQDFEVIKAFDSLKSTGVIYNNFMKLFYDALTKILISCNRNIVLFVVDDFVSRFSMSFSSVGRTIGLWDRKYYFPKYPKHKYYHTVEKIRNSIISGVYVLVPKWDAREISCGWLIYLECGFSLLNKEPAFSHCVVPILGKDIIISYPTSNFYNEAMYIIKKYHYIAFPETVIDKRAQDYVSDESPFKEHREEMIRQYSNKYCKDYDNFPASESPTIKIVLGSAGAGKSTFLSNNKGFQIMLDEILLELEFIDGITFKQWEHSMHEEIKRELSVLKNSKLIKVLLPTLIQSYRINVSLLLYPKYPLPISMNLLNHIDKSLHKACVIIECSKYMIYLMTLKFLGLKVEVISLYNPPNIQYFHSLHRFKFEHRMYLYKYVMDSNFLLWDALKTNQQDHIYVFKSSFNGDLIPSSLEEAIKYYN